MMLIEINNQNQQKKKSNLLSVRSASSSCWFCCWHCFAHFVQFVLFNFWVDATQNATFIIRSTHCRWSDRLLDQECVRCSRWGVSKTKQINCSVNRSRRLHRATPLKSFIFKTFSQKKIVLQSTQCDWNVNFVIIHNEMIYEVSSAGCFSFLYTRFQWYTTNPFESLFLFSTFESFFGVGGDCQWVPLNTSAVKTSQNTQWRVRIENETGKNQRVF